MNKLLSALMIATTGFFSLQAKAGVEEYISVQMLLNSPRTHLPDLFYLDKTKNDLIAFEVYNRSDRPISCKNLFIEVYVAPIGNCMDASRIRLVNLRFKNVNLWKIQREPNEPNPWGMNYVYDAYQYWKPYEANDLGLNALYYNLDGAHPYYRQRFTGEEDLATAAAKMGLTVNDVEYCPNPSLRTYTSECYFGCFSDDKNLKERSNQTCYKGPSQGL